MAPPQKSPHATRNLARKRPLDLGPYFGQKTHTDPLARRHAGRRRSRAKLCEAARSSAKPREAPRSPARPREASPGPAPREAPPVGLLLAQVLLGVVLRFARESDIHPSSAAGARRAAAVACRQLFRAMAMTTPDKTLIAQATRRRICHATPAPDQHAPLERGAAPVGIEACASCWAGRLCR